MKRINLKKSTETQGALAKPTIEQHFSSFVHEILDEIKVFLKVIKSAFEGVDGGERKPSSWMGFGNQCYRSWCEGPVATSSATWSMNSISLLHTSFFLAPALSQKKKRKSE